MHCARAWAPLCCTALHCTALHRNFKEKGTCLYGDLCQFAYGKHELRSDVVRHG